MRRRGEEEQEDKKRTFRPPRLLTDKTFDRERENKKLQQRQQTRGIEREKLLLCVWVGEKECDDDVDY